MVLDILILCVNSIYYYFYCLRQQNYRFTKKRIKRLYWEGNDNERTIAACNSDALCVHKCKCGCNVKTLNGNNR